MKSAKPDHFTFSLQLLLSDEMIRHHRKPSRASQAFSKIREDPGGDCNSMINLIQN
jgi:hypothetical protein